MTSHGPHFFKQTKILLFVKISNPIFLAKNVVHMNSILTNFEKNNFIKSSKLGNKLNRTIT